MTSPILEPFNQQYELALFLALKGDQDPDWALQQISIISKLRCK
ncbi:MAG: hypothetical protein QXP27_00325 [Candidatus Methanomethyliaceae archaeon]